jgi:hypothetical protein
MELMDITDDSFKRKRKLDELYDMESTDNSDIGTIRSHQTNVPSKAKLIIHNQCSNTRLISSVYFGNGTVYPKISDQRICIGTETKVGFEINTVQDDFEGALLFRLQRYSDWYNINTSTTETNEATYIQMLVVCEMKDARSFVYVVLVEHAETFTWNEDKLKRYNCFRLDAWIMHNNIVLKTTFSASDLGGVTVLNISVSEVRYFRAMKALWIDTER